MNNAMFLLNNKKTALRMTRETQLIGGTVESSFSRELIIRKGTAIRDSLPTLIDNIGATMNPKYQLWDMAEVKNSCVNDIASLDCKELGVDSPGCISHWPWKPIVLHGSETGSFGSRGTPVVRSTDTRGFRHHGGRHQLRPRRSRRSRQRSRSSWR